MTDWVLAFWMEKIDGLYNSMVDTIPDYQQVSFEDYKYVVNEVRHEISLLIG